MKSERIINAINLIVCVIAGAFVLYLCFAVCTANAQTTWTEVKRDTVMSENIHVQEYTKKDGTMGIKAQWCGKAVSVSYKDGDAILEGDDAAVVLVTYKVDDRTVVEPKKIIAVNMRRGR